MILIEGMSQNSILNVKVIRAEDVKCDDYLAFRSSAIEIISEYAERILMNNNGQKFLDLATSWQPLLRQALEGADFCDIVHNFRTLGCLRTEAAIRNWIYNPDFIAPQKKEDMRFIALASKNQNLIMNWQTIFEATHIVKRAHIKAGKHISEKVKNVVAKKMRDFKEQNKGYFPSPLIVSIEGIGDIQILKVSTISQSIQMPTSRVNKLLERS
jgi:hypothetical protein